MAPNYEDAKSEYFTGQGLTPYEILGKQIFPYKAGTVVKCTFCIERVEWLKKGLKPGVDREAAPACAITCPTVTRTFGDLDDPNSEVSPMITYRKALPLRPDFDTEPFYILSPYITRIIKTKFPAPRSINTSGVFIYW